MIIKVDITSAQGGFLSLPLEDVLTGFLVQEIDGLDPVKATLVSTVFAQQPGAQFQSSRREPRDIKFTLGLEPDWTVGETVRDLRRRLYNTFMPESSVLMEFNLADGQVLNITGVVESFESTIFSKDPAVDIVVRCFDPDFIDPVLVTLEEETVADSTMTSFDYEGTVARGILFKLMVDRTISGFTIYHQSSDGNPHSMLVSASLVAGDVVTISTISGNKFATLTRASVDSSILYGVAPEANWFSLLPGLNNIRVEVSGAPIPYTVEYVRRYGGL